MSLPLNKNFIPNKVASELSGYSTDYIARLCREGKIEGTQIGRGWVVNQESLERFIRQQDERKKQISRELSRSREREYKARVQGAGFPVASNVAEIIAPSKSGAVKLVRMRSFDGVLRRLPTGPRLRDVHPSLRQGFALAVTMLVIMGAVLVSQTGLVNRFSERVVASASSISGVEGILPERATLAVYRVGDIIARATERSVVSAPHAYRATVLAIVSTPRESAAAVATAPQNTPYGFRAALAFFTDSIARFVHGVGNRIAGFFGPRTTELTILPFEAATLHPSTALPSPQIQPDGTFTYGTNTTQAITTTIAGGVSSAYVQNYVSSYVTQALFGLSARIGAEVLDGKTVHAPHGIGPAGSFQSGLNISLVSVASETNGLTSSLSITGANDTLTFTPSLSGTLSNAGGGTGTTTYYSGGIVFSDGTKLTQAANTGANAFVWDNTNGYLGIGTSTPARALTVAGVARIEGTSPQLELVQDGAAADNQNWRLFGDTNGFFTIESRDASNTSIGELLVAHDGSLVVGEASGYSATPPAKLYVKGNGIDPVAYFANGNVGIGTSTPSAQLHIVNTASPATLTLESTTGNARFQLKNGNGNFWNLLTQTSDNGLRFQYNGASSFFLSANGVASVGGINTNALFNVASSTATIPYLNVGNISNVYFTVANSGFVGIATSSPWGQLSVDTTSLTGPAFAVGSSAGTNFIVANNGTVGIGTTSPSFNLAVAGDGYFTGNLRVGDNFNVQNGAITIGSATSTFAVNGTINSNLIPSVNKTYDLGSPSFYWNRAYIDTLSVNSISAASTTIGGTASNDFTLNSDNATVDTEDVNLIFFRGLVNPNAVIGWNSTRDRFEFNQPTFIQNQSSTTTIPTLTLKSSATQTSDVLDLLDSNGVPLSSFGLATTSITNDVQFGGTSGLTFSDFYGTGKRVLLIGSTSPLSQSVQYLSTGVRYAVNIDAGGLGGTGSLAIYSGTTTPSLTAAGQPGAVYLNNFNNFAGVYLRKTGTGVGDYIVAETNTGAPIFTVKSSGNVGIASTTPWGLLSLNPNALGSGVPEFVIGSSSATHFLVDGAGGVAIGTTTANGFSLYVSGASPKLALDDNGTGSAPGIRYRNQGTNVGELQYFTTENRFRIFSGGTNTASERFTILGSNGNVGIGTTSPDAKLTVNSNTGTLATAPAGTIGHFVGVDSTSPILDVDAYASNANLTLRRANGTGALPSAVANGDEIGRLMFNGYGTTGFLGGSGAAIKAVASETWSDSTGGTNLVFSTRASGQTGGATDRAVLTSLGNFGLGTTTPWAQLSVNPNALGSGVPEFVIGSSSATHFIVIGNGNVGIGTTSPGALLDVNGPADTRAIVVGDSFSITPEPVAGVRRKAYLSVNTYPDPVSGWATTDTTLGGFVVQIQGESSDAVSAIKFRYRNAGSAGNTSPTTVVNFSNTGGLSLGSTFAATNAPTGGAIIQGNVGIGSTTPWGQLSVNPNGITGPAFVIGSSTATNFYVGNDGLVSIGTSSTALVGANLNVVANSTSAKIITINESASGISSNQLFNSSLDNIEMILGGRSDAGTYFGLSRAGAGIFGGTPQTFLAVGTRNATPLIFATNNLERARIDSSGRLGVGTSTPAFTLDVGGKINTDKFSGYYQDANLLAYASSTNGATIFGFGAGGQNATTSATNNHLTAFGFQAANSLTTGQENTVFGYQALSKNLISNYNTAIGSLALQNTTSAFNTAVGYSALNTLTTGSQNTGVGMSAGAGITSGTDNVAIGSSVLNAGSAGGGSFNVALGSHALGSRVNGNSNIAIGYNTLGGGGDGSGSNDNIGIGNQALFNNTGSKNIALGRLAAWDQVGGSNNIALGAFVDLPDLTGSQQLNIGNVVYGTGIYNGGGNSSAPVSNALLGIGSTSPYADFSIHAVAGSPNTTVFAIGSSTAAFATSTLFVVTNTGNVGIGTSNPGTSLQIVGGSIRLDNNQGVQIKDNANGPVAVLTIDTSNNLSVRSSLTSGDAFYGLSNASATGALHLQTAGANQLNILSGGNVGIGIASPQAKLDVSGTLRITQASGQDSIQFYSTTASAVKWVQDIVGNDLQFYDSTNGVERVRFAAGGNVGVGSSTPWAQLSASSTSANPAFAVAQQGTGPAALFFGGNVGIGTTSPMSPFSVLGSATFASDRGSLTVMDTHSGATLNRGGWKLSEGSNGCFDGYFNLGTTTACDTTVPSFQITDLGAVKINNGAGLTVGGNINASSITLTATPSITLPNSGSIVGSGAASLSIGDSNDTLSFNGTNAFDSNNASVTASFTNSSTGNIARFYKGTTEILTAANNGNVGIGTTTPWAQLSVNPTSALAGAPEFFVGSTSASHFIVTGSGNVGIGTTSPIATLAVVGNLFIKGQTTQYIASTAFYSTTQRNTNYIGFLGNGSDYFLNYDTLNERVTIGNGATAGSRLSVTGNESIGSTFYATAAPTNGLIVEGNVGIGTTSPDTALTVFKGAGGTVTDNVHITGVYGGIGGGHGIVFGDDTGVLYARLHDIVEAGGAVGLAFDTRSSGTLNEKVRISTSGNVGIGTTTPGSLLEVVASGGFTPSAQTIASFVRNSTSVTDAVVSINSGNAAKAVLRFGDTDSEAMGIIKYDNALNSLSFGTNGVNDYLTINSSGNVGIGTTSPGALFSVAGAGLFSNTVTAGAVNVTGSTIPANGIFLQATNVLGFASNGSDYIHLTSSGNFRSANSSSWALQNATPSATTPVFIPNGGDFTTGLGASASGALSLITAGVDRLEVTNGGNVGIGTTSPGAALEVNGNILIANGQNIQARNVDGTIRSIITYNSGNNLSINSGVNGSGKGSLTIIGNNNSILQTTAGELDLMATQSNTGFITFSTGGSSEKARLDASGNFGIGTTSPFSRLSLVGADTSTNIITVDALSGFAGNFADFKVASSSRAQLATGAGSSGRLRLARFSDSSIAITLEGTNNARNGDGATLTYSGGTGEAISFDGGSGYIGFYTNSNTTERARIDSSGNFGIGTTNPTAKLHVVNTVASSTDQGVGVTLSSTFGGSQGGISTVYGYQTNATANPSAGTFGTLQANFTQALFAGTGGSQVTNLTGVFARTGISGTSPTGTINNGVAFDIDSPTNQATTPSITINNQYGLRIQNQGATSGYTPTSLTGINVRSQTGGTNNSDIVFGQNSIPTGNYGIYQGDSYQNYFQGNVGIGTTSPWAQLSVNPTSALAGAPEFVIGSSSATHLVVTGAGNVGIGTTSPGFALDVEGTGVISAGTGANGGNLRFRDTGGTARYALARSTGTANALILGDGANLGTKVGIGHAITDTLLQTLDVNGTGYFSSTVGIGTTTPFSTAKLDVVGNVAVEANGQLKLYNTDDSNFAFLKNFGGSGVTSNSFGIAVSGNNPDLLVSSTGNVGIGTTSPTYRLDVVAGGTAQPNIKLENSVNNNGLAFIGVAGTTNGLIAGDASGDLDLYTQSGKINFSANNGTTNALTLATSGFVGIGTTTPLKQFVVSNTSGSTNVTVDTAASNAALRLTATNVSFVDLVSSGGTGTLAEQTDGSIRLGITGSASSNLVISSAGNVGIGTTTPGTGAALTVAGTSIKLAGTSSTGNGVGLNLQNYAGTNAWVLGTGGATIGANDFSIGDNSNYRLVINGSTGNVGIGTTTPNTFSNKLFVNGTFGITNNSPLYSVNAAGTALREIARVDSSDQVQIGGNLITLTSSGVSQMLLTGNPTIQNQSNGTITLQGFNGTGQQSLLALSPTATVFNNGANATDFTIKASGASSAFFVQGSSGNVGIGTTSPTATLSVSIASTTAPLYIGAAGSSTPSLFVASANNNGNVGIGTSSPRAQLTTTGTVQFANFGAGSLQTDANGNVTVSSDERLKNIDGSFSRGLADILKLNPILYRWNAISGLDQTAENAGFSAQNVKGAIPEAVGMDKRGYLTLADRPILAAAVNAIKDLANQTTSLSDATTTLSVRLEGVEQQLAQPSLPETLTATSISTDSLSATGDLIAANVEAAGVVSANTFSVPATNQSFLIGSTTIVAAPPADVLLANGQVDIYKLASYALASVRGLSVRFDTLEARVNNLDTRLAALEAAQLTLASSTTIITEQAVGTTTATTTLTSQYGDASSGLQAAVLAAIQNLWNAEEAAGKPVLAFGKAIQATTGFFDKVFAKEVHTDQVCVGETCINEAQLKQLLQNAGTAPATQGVSGTDSTSGTSTPSQPEPGSQVIEVGSTTPSIAPLIEVTDTIPAGTTSSTPTDSSTSTSAPAPAASTDTTSSTSAPAPSAP